MTQTSGDGGDGEPGLVTGHPAHMASHYKLFTTSQTEKREKFDPGICNSIPCIIIIMRGCVNSEKRSLLLL